MGLIWSKREKAEMKASWSAVVKSVTDLFENNPAIGSWLAKAAGAPGRAWENFDEFRRVLVAKQAESRRRLNFLDSEVREKYVFENYEALRRGKAWKAKLDTYDALEADPLFRTVLKQIGGEEMVEVWEAERQIYARAQELTQAEVSAHRKKEKKEHDAAVDQGLNLQEFRSQQKRGIAGNE